MSTPPMNRVIQHLQAACGRDGGGLTDGELLTSFLSNRDDAAFAPLVRRHGPMVWGVCSRLLRNHHDAEDAFQATFLVLVTKASSLPDKDTVGKWLYGVAHQTAVRMRATAAKRGGRERQYAVMPESATAEKNIWNDIQPVLDEELSRLPDKYRTLIVLCDLKGMTRAEVARYLGVPEGTAATRLATARAMLAKRLTRRGIVLSGVLLGALLSQQLACSSVPVTLADSTIKAASVCATGQTAAMISEEVAALTQGVLKTMFLAKLKATTAGLLLIALLGGTVGAIYQTQAAEQPKGEPKTGKSSDVSGHFVQAVKEPLKLKADAESEKLPEGAVARLGFGKFRVGGATDVVFSPDGNYIAAKASSDTIHVWDVKTGRSIRAFPLERSQQLKFGKQGLIPDASRFSFSANGKSLVTYSNGLDRAWQRNIETGEEEKLPGDLSSKKLCALRYSADGKALVAIHEDLTVKLHDPISGKEISQVATLPDRNSCAAVAFSKNGQLLLLPKYDDVAGKTIIEVIDVKTGMSVRTLEASPKYPIKYVTTTADSSKVFAIDTIHIHAWDAATGKDINDFSKRIGSPFDSFVLTPDDKTLLILHGNNLVFWDLPGSKLLRRVPLGSGHRSLALSPDGKTVAVGSNQSVKLLDFATGDVLHKIGGHESRITAVAISPDGKTALTAANDRQVADWKSAFITLRRWDSRTGAELKVDTLTDTDNSFDLIFSRDAKKLAFRRYQPLVRINDFQIWNTSDGTLAHKVSNATIKGKEGVWPWKLAFDTPGKHLAVIFDKGTLELYDVERGTELRTIAGAVNSNCLPVFSPDGRTVAAWRSRGNGRLTNQVEGGHIHIFEALTGKELSTIAFESGVSNLRYTPDGRILAISYRDTIHLWDVGNRKRLREIKAGGTKLADGPFAISEDSKFLASGDRNGAVEVWNIESGNRVGRHEGHTDRITAMAFSPDGSRLITGSADGIALIWDFAKLKVGGHAIPK